MLVYHVIALAALVVVVATAVGNARYLKRVARSRASGSGRVSVCIPARDEAHRLGPCLESLSSQTWPDLEVLVLDDQSSDGTGDLARSFANRVPSLRVLDGAPLAPGWLGKPHACARLAAHATGDWLLFTDADVVFAPDGVARGVETAVATRADLFTALPRQQLGTLAESLTVPFVYWGVAGFLPMFWMEQSDNVRMGAASGQYLLFSRRAYDAIGGHDAVRENVVEDVGLARAVRAAKLRLVIADGRDYVACRMYTGWRDMWEGFSKNAYAGIGGSPVSLVVFLAVWIGLFLVPPIACAVAFATGGAWRLFAIETALAVLGRLVVASTFGQPLWTALAHPISVCLSIAVAIRGFWKTTFGRGVRWKGREIRVSPVHEASHRERGRR